MKNWAGNIKWNPSQTVYPETEEGIREVVLRAANNGKKLRVIGTGHSFTPVCVTDDILMSLDKYQGLVRVNQDKLQATVRGGTKLNNLGDLLYQHGLAMENLGDIDVQSIAGTISTGTHGTGAQFGTISTQVIALRFINGEGEIISCSQTENVELFKAAQVSLGLLGVIVELTIQCVSAYKLSLVNKVEPVDQVMSTLQARLKDNRNFEFYWFPYTNKLITKTTNEATDIVPDKVNFFNYWSEYVLENYAFKLVCEYGSWFPNQAPKIAQFTADMASNVNKVAHSHKVYATQRMVRFMEMEYNIPAEAYTDVWKDVTSAINKHRFNVHFPLENRWVKRDDIYMSPAYGRDSAYIACHVYHKKDCKPYFKVLEEIFKAYDGRPHWGKMNTLTVEDVVERYPKYPEFMKFVQLHDPQGIFMSPYMSTLLTNEKAVSL